LSYTWFIVLICQVSVGVKGQDQILNCESLSKGPNLKDIVLSQISTTTNHLFFSVVIVFTTHLPLSAKLKVWIIPVMRGKRMREKNEWMLTYIFHTSRVSLWKDGKNLFHSSLEKMMQTNSRDRMEKSLARLWQIFVYLQRQYDTACNHLVICSWKESEWFWFPKVAMTAKIYWISHLSPTHHCQTSALLGHHRTLNEQWD
jgi:hypothetical protein